MPGESERDRLRKRTKALLKQREATPRLEVKQGVVIERLKQGERSHEVQEKKLAALRRGLRYTCWEIGEPSLDTKLESETLTLEELEQSEPLGEIDATPAERRAKLGDTVAAVIARDIPVSGVGAKGENDPTEGEGGASAPEMSEEEAARVAAALARKNK